MQEAWNRVRRAFRESAAIAREAEHVVHPGHGLDDSGMKVIAAAFFVTAALVVVGVGIGATQFGHNSEQASGQNPQAPSSARSADSSADFTEKVAECRQDALSDRDADDPKEALADDGCQGVPSDDGD